MLTQTAPVAADIPVGAKVTTLDHPLGQVTGTMTVRRTVLGDRIVATDTGAWVAVNPTTLVVADPDSFAADGSVAWGAQHGCPLGTVDMGCDMTSGCVGECCTGLLPRDAGDVLLDAPGAVLDEPLYVGEAIGARRVLISGLYSGWRIGGDCDEPIFVLIGDYTGVRVYRRG